jgi:hypothetical protein
MLDEGESCQAIFDSFLVLEYTVPAFGEVHMLTVACFMIQHKRYSDEAMVWIEQQLRAYLEDDRQVEEIRRQAGREVDQAKRDWKVTRQPGARPLPEVSWSMTIQDVAGGYQDAENYRRLVKQWAKVTLDEMKPYL